MKFFSKRERIPSSVALDERNDFGASIASPSSVSTGFSLGAGNFSFDGASVDNFVPSPRKGTRENESQLPTTPSRTGSSFVKRMKEPLEKILHKPIVFKRDVCAFLRVSDLKIEESMSIQSNTVADTNSASSDADGEIEVYPNFHHASIDPPPGVKHDPTERWIALDDGEGKHAPIAPFAVEALAQSARLTTLNDEAMWKPDSKTAKLLKDPKTWAVCTWAAKETPSRGEGENACAVPHADLLPAPGTSEEEQIFMWSGNFTHGLYGSDLPAVRSACIMPTSARALMELFLDSSRVHEYNKLSLGRTDLLVLQDDMSPDGPFGGITKISRSETSPPLIRKTLQFTSLLHARCLPTGGYKLVTRAVEKPETHPSAALKSEILLGVNVILPIDDTRCLLILVNHISSPMVPMMVAKRIGLQAAVNFISDVRACFR